MKKSLLGIIALPVIALTLAGCSSSASKDKTVNVGVLQIVQHGSLDAARKGFESELTKEIKDKQPKWQVAFNYQNAQGDQANLNTMSRQIVQKKPDLILAIATPSAQTVAKQTKTTPILTTAVTDLKSAGLVKSTEKPGTNVSGTMDLGPVDKQLKLLKSLTKNNKPIGVMYNSSEENSGLQVNMAKQYAKKNNLKLKVISVNSSNDVQSALSVLSNKISGLYLPTDNLMASSMKIIGKVAGEKKLPVVTGSIEMAQDGGTATYGINYRDLGKQTAKMAAKVILDKKNPKDMPVEKSKTLRLYVNNERAKKLGIDPAKIQEP
ncbi:ABC transporter substrate-binding protein [Lentilactobacillus sp. SPB1-3]|uniref:ABC transporter substrate-binding protein n=1 Tax=Lentilactobacillus terminaliae TaxID=3003483 RepID=A0ACD5DEG9_9LACO|nr:ABC transporter substrate-binding protein [Lentilactobacillus sp. SPB1-3]MCZ0977563.1 ABC transporter substrate-binding protein [Lentilactobacillus sp. SPB1-3]